MKKDISDVAGWDTFVFESCDELMQTIKHINDSKDRKWLSRGQNTCIKMLIPKIDREPYSKITKREDKLALERASIDLFKITASPIASKNERIELTYDIGALMVLQHYGGFTRLLDWSRDPLVSTYFAVNDYDDKPGELWCFEYYGYETQGGKQWKNYPDILGDSSIHVRYRQLLDSTNPNPYFFMCIFDYLRFNRLNAQSGLFSVTSTFSKDHAEAISFLFKNDKNSYCRYVIKREFKKEIRKILKEQYNIWDGTLFPDTAGAAESVKKQFEKSASQLLSVSSSAKK